MIIVLDRPISLSWFSSNPEELV